eukprot:Lankesteria_metandrocarpae@DN5196_c0_g1_i3.p1
MTFAAMIKKNCCLFQLLVLSNLLLRYVDAQECHLKMNEGMPAVEAVLIGKVEIVEREFTFFVDRCLCPPSRTCCRHVKGDFFDMTIQNESLEEIGIAREEGVTCDIRAINEHFPYLPVPPLFDDGGAAIEIRATLRCKDVLCYLDTEYNGYKTTFPIVVPAKPDTDTAPRSPRLSGSPESPRSSRSPHSPRLSGSPESPRSSRSPHSPRLSGS